MRRWIDVNPTDWFYRDVLEAGRIRLDMDGEQEFIAGIGYNMFEGQKGRIVKRFVTVDGQKEFIVPGYTPSPTNPIFVIVGGVEITPEKVEKDKVILSNPLSGGIEVILVSYGSPKTQTLGCRKNYPATVCPYESAMHPSAEFKHKAQWIDFFLNSQVNLRKPESVSVMGQKLRIIYLNTYAGTPYLSMVKQAIGYKRDVAVIHNGTVYVPFIYNDFPVQVTYNYYDEAGGIMKQATETVIPHSECAIYNDRFFPNVTMLRSEFFSLLQRLRISIYNRYTDKPFQITSSQTRSISDRSSIIGKWYANDVLDILEEKYLDGCYVFPLYEDGRFEPEECITRAEVVTYLNRFIEWAIEKFR